MCQWCVLYTHSTVLRFHTVYWTAKAEVESGVHEFLKLTRRHHSRDSRDSRPEISYPKIVHLQCPQKGETNITIKNEDVGSKTTLDVFSPVFEPEADISKPICRASELTEQKEENDGSGHEESAGEGIIVL